MQELHSTTRKEVQTQCVQTETAFLQSTQATQTPARPTKSCATQHRVVSTSTPSQCGPSFLLDLITISTQTHKSLTYSSQTQTFIQVFDDSCAQTDEDLLYDLRAVHKQLELLQSELDNQQIAHQH
jgi:hypothetical protein